MLQAKTQESLLKRDSNTDVFLWILRSLLQQLFLWNTPGGCFCQFEKVTAQYWASADRPFLIKNTMWDDFYEKGLDLLKVRLVGFSLV